MHPTFI